jgi:hypothetical protein
LQFCTRYDNHGGDFAPLVNTSSHDINKRFTGTHLVEKITTDPHGTFDVVFLWNRDTSKAEDLAKKSLDLKRQQGASSTAAGTCHSHPPATSLLVLDNLDEDLAVSLQVFELFDHFDAAVRNKDDSPRREQPVLNVQCSVSHFHFSLGVGSIFRNIEIDLSLRKRQQIWCECFHKTTILCPFYVGTKFTYFFIMFVTRMTHLVVNSPC